MVCLLLIMSVLSCSALQEHIANQSLCNATLTACLAPSSHNPIWDMHKRATTLVYIRMQTCTHPVIHASGYICHIRVHKYGVVCISISDVTGSV